MITKVISGGQTGADQAGLLAARACGIETGGTAPDGFYTDAGENYLLSTFGLIAQGDYRSRTVKNVKDADGTVLLSITLESPGSILTRNESKRQGKPYIEFDLVEISGIRRQGAEFQLEYVGLRQAITNDLVKFIAENNIQVLNVAGNRERSKKFETTKLVVDILTHTFKTLS